MCSTINQYQKLVLQIPSHSLTTQRVGLFHTWMRVHQGYALLSILPTLEWFGFPGLALKASPKHVLGVCLKTRPLRISACNWTSLIYDCCCCLVRPHRQMNPQFGLTLRCCWWWVLHFSYCHQFCIAFVEWMSWEEGIRNVHECTFNAWPTLNSGTIDQRSGDWAWSGVVLVLCWCQKIDRSKRTETEVVGLDGDGRKNKSFAFPRKLSNE